MPVESQPSRHWTDGVLAGKNGELTSPESAGVGRSSYQTFTQFTDPSAATLTARLVTEPQAIANTGGVALLWQEYTSGGTAVRIGDSGQAIEFWDAQGLYDLHIEVVWEEDATGGRRISLERSGGAMTPIHYGYQSIVHAGAFRTGEHQQMYIASFAVIDAEYVDPENPNGSLSIYVQQDSGGSLDVTFAELRITKVAGVVA